MRLGVKCPRCAATYSVPEKHTGRRARCRCGHVFVVMGGEGSPLPAKGSGPRCDRTAGQVPQPTQRDGAVDAVPLSGTVDSFSTKPAGAPSNATGILPVSPTVDLDTGAPSASSAVAGREAPSLPEHERGSAAPLAASAPGTLAAKPVGGIQPVCDPLFPDSIAVDAPFANSVELQADVCLEPDSPEAAPPLVEPKPTAPSLTAPSVATGQAPVRMLPLREGGKAAPVSTSLAAIPEATAAPTDEHARVIAPEQASSAVASGLEVIPQRQLGGSCVDLGVVGAVTGQANRFVNGNAPVAAGPELPRDGKQRTAVLEFGSPCTVCASPEPSSAPESRSSDGTVLVANRSAYVPTGVFERTRRGILKLVTAFLGFVALDAVVFLIWGGLGGAMAQTSGMTALMGILNILFVLPLACFVGIPLASVRYIARLTKNRDPRLHKRICILFPLAVGGTLLLIMSVALGLLQHAPAEPDAILISIGFVILCTLLGLLIAAKASHSNLPVFCESCGLMTRRQQKVLDKPGAIGLLQCLESNDFSQIGSLARQGRNQEMFFLHIEKCPTCFRSVVTLSGVLPDGAGCSSTRRSISRWLSGDQTKLLEAALATSSCSNLPGVSSTQPPSDNSCAVATAACPNRPAAGPIRANTPPSDDAPKASLPTPPWYNRDLTPLPRWIEKRPPGRRWRILAFACLCVLMGLVSVATTIYTGPVGPERQHGLFGIFLAFIVASYILGIIGIVLLIGLAAWAYKSKHLRLQAGSLRISGIAKAIAVVLGAIVGLLVLATFGLVKQFLNAAGLRSSVIDLLLFIVGISSAFQAGRGVARAIKVVMSSKRSYGAGSRRIGAEGQPDLLQADREPEVLAAPVGAPTAGQPERPLVEEATVVMANGPVPALTGVNPQDWGNEMAQRAETELVEASPGSQAVPGPLAVTDAADSWDTAPRPRTPRLARVLTTLLCLSFVAFVVAYVLTLAHRFSDPDYDLVPSTAVDTGGGLLAIEVGGLKYKTRQWPLLGLLTLCVLLLFIRLLLGRRLQLRTPRDRRRRLLAPQRWLTYSLGGLAVLSFLLLILLSAMTLAGKTTVATGRPVLFIQLESQKMFDLAETSYRTNYWPLATGWLAAAVCTAAWLACVRKLHQQQLVSPAIAASVVASPASPHDTVGTAKAGREPGAGAQDGEAPPSGPGDPTAQATMPSPYAQQPSAMSKRSLLSRMPTWPLPGVAIVACLASGFAASTAWHRGVSYLQIVATSPAWAIRFRCAEYGELDRVEPSAVNQSPESIKNRCHLRGTRATGYVAIMLHCVAAKDGTYKTHFPDVRIVGTTQVLPVRAVAMLDEDACRAGMGDGVLPVVGPPVPVSVESTGSQGRAVNVVVVAKLPLGVRATQDPMWLEIDGLFDTTSFRIPFAGGGRESKSTGRGE